MVTFRNNAWHAHELWKRKLKSGGSGLGNLGLTTYCAVEDGTASVDMDKGWAKLTFLTADGSWATVENGDLRMGRSGDVVAMFDVTIDHRNGRIVYFGYGWDGALPTVFDQIDIVNELYPYHVVRTVTVPAIDSLLSFYITTNYSAKNVTWTGGMLTINIEEEPTP